MQKPQANKATNRGTKEETVTERQRGREREEMQTKCGNTKHKNQLNYWQLRESPLNSARQLCGTHTYTQNKYIVYTFIYMVYWYCIGSGSTSPSLSLSLSLSLSC